MFSYHFIDLGKVMPINNVLPLVPAAPEKCPYFHAVKLVQYYQDKPRKKIPGKFLSMCQYGFQYPAIVCCLFFG